MAEEALTQYRLLALPTHLLTVCRCTHTDRVLAIRAICDEVNAGLMTGHGAHAFNQTYQPPRHHPVKNLSSAATFVEKIQGET